MSRQVSEQKTIIFRKRAPAARRRAPAGQRPNPLAPPPDVHVPVPGRRPTRPATRPRRRWLAVLFVLVFFLLVGAVAAGAAAYLAQRNRILPGVHTLGVRLGGQRVEEATTALARNWDSRQITIDAGEGEVYTLRPATLGITLDAEATALAAYRQGRNIPDIEAALRNAFSDTGFEPTWTFDPAAARTSLEDLSAQISVEPVNAGVRYANGRVETTPAQPGRELDVEATVSWLQQNAGLVALSGRLPLVTHTLQPSVTDSSAIAAQLNERLNQELSIHAYDPVRNDTHEAVVPPEAWTGWVTLQPDPASPGMVSWQVDQRQMEAYLDAQAAAFGPDRYLDTAATADALSRAIHAGETVTNLRIYHRDSTHIIQPGETLSSIAYDYGIPYPWIQQANPGSGDGLHPGQTITIPSPDVLLPLPVVPGKRIVVSLSQQRMWVYENGAVRWEWPVSTGIDSSPTAPGVFQVQSHEPNAYAGNWDLWMPNFMGIYRPVPTSDFMNGFHGFPTRNGANLLWTNSLGRRVTYGCILISNDNAPLLYDWAEEGVVVEVQR